MKRREVLLALASLAAAGCANTPLVNSYVASIRAASQKRTGPTLTREKVDAIPYATMGLSVAGGPAAMVVLEKSQGDEHHWLAADRLKVVTRRGRLVATDGLRRDLAGQRLGAPDPVVEGLQRLHGPASLSGEVDLRPGDYRSIERRSEFFIAGAETISILGTPYPTIHVTETLFLPRWSWKTENHFWADPATGFVWKSVQRYSPDMPSLAMEVFKRPA